jgi:hypothetical protein
MTRSPSKLQVLLPAAMLVTLAACQAKKSENPLSPSVAGPIPGVEISAPRLLEPSQGFKFKENQQPIKLVVENSVTTGVRKLLYYFEVSSDQGFANKVYARGGVPEGDGRTSVQLDALELGRAYYWRAWTDDGANRSTTSSTAGFEVLPRALLTVPTAASPVNNAAVAERNPTLRINNSSHNSAVGPVSYFFMVAKDQAFTQISATGIVGEGGVTQWRVDRELDYGLTHFWRVRATDGEITTDWSPTAVFKTPAAPAPPGGGGPGIPPGAPCNAPDPLKIVECERAKYGHMSHSQMLDFLRATVQSLNRNGISGAPFGILRKGGGENCGGYSCDVICSGQGSGQRQWDILGDIDGSQWPGWGGPNTVPNIRVDVCEVQ